MEYLDTKIVPQKERTVVKPMADNIRDLTDIPRPTVSTRVHFKDLDLSALTDDMLDVPMNVGIEQANGTIISIWEVEQLRATLGGSDKIGFKPFLEVGKEEPNDADKNYTYINEDTAVGHIGTNGDRFKTADGKFITLRWAMTEATVSELPNQAKYMVNGDGVLLTAIGIYQGTMLADYHNNLNFNDILEELPNLIYVKPNTWYWLPHKNTLNNRQLLSSMKGKHSTIISYDDTTGAEATRYNSDMENALVSYLSSKASNFKSITFVSSYDIDEERISIRGEGQLYFESPRDKPLDRHRIPKPPQYDELKAIWLQRFPLKLVMDLIMIKGFRISSDYYKKSVTIGAMTTNYGKTTLYARAMINNNLLETVMFSRLVNTIGEGEKIGSVPLNTLYTKAIVLADEAADILDVPKTLAASVIKNVATGSVEGAVKNQLAMKIENFPLFQMLARDNMQDHMRSLADDDELDTRTLYPVFGNNTAREDFKGYSEAQTLDSLQCLIYDMFYEQHDKLKPMTPEQRADYMDENFKVVEEKYDRERARLVAKTLPILAVVDIVSQTVFKPAEFRQLSKGGEPNELSDYACVDVNGGVLIGKALKYEYGIHYHMNNMTDQGTQYKVVQRANFECIADTRAGIGRNIPETKVREAYRTKSTFYVPLDRTDIAHKKEAFDKYALSLIQSDELKQAYVAMDIVPFLAKLMTSTVRNVKMISLVVGMYHHWSNVDEVEEIIPKGDEDGFVF